MKKFVFIFSLWALMVLPYVGYGQENDNGDEEDVEVVEEIQDNVAPEDDSYLDEKVEVIEEKVEPEDDSYLDEKITVESESDSLTEGSEEDLFALVTDVNEAMKSKKFRDAYRKGTIMMYMILTYEALDYVANKEIVYYCKNKLKFEADKDFEISTRNFDRYYLTMTMPGEKNYTSLRDGMAPILDGVNGVAGLATTSTKDTFLLDLLDNIDKNYHSLLITDLKPVNESALEITKLYAILHTMGDAEYHNKLCIYSLDKDVKEILAKLNEGHTINSTAEPFFMKALEIANTAVNLVPPERYHNTESFGKTVRSGMNQLRLMYAALSKPIVD